MARTNAERFTESINYIKTNISADLAARLGGVDKEKAGKQISLEGFSYSVVGWDEQHRAVRALLLCHYHFLGAYAFPSEAKRFFKSKSKSEVNKYIKAYTKDSPTLESLAQKAEEFNLEQGDLSFYNRKREDNKFGGGSIICYTGVLLWLFQAGFITMKWYLDNNGMNAYNCNRILGDGTEWDIDRMEDIPRGYIWNFQGIRPEVCHWGISLGKGRAAGTNNHTAEGTKKVAFEGGGGLIYGKFNLRSQYEVLKIKYGSANIKDASSDKETSFVAKDDVETKLFVIDPTRIIFT